MIDAIFNTSRYETENAKKRAQILYAVLFAFAGLFAVYAFTVEEWFLNNGIGTFTLFEAVVEYGSRRETLIFLSVIATLAIGYATNFAGYAQIAGWSVVTTIFIINTILIRFSIDPTATAGTIILLFVVTAMLVGGQYIPFMWCASVLMVLLRAFGSNVYDSGALSIATAILVISAGAILIFYYLRVIVLSTEEAAAEAVEEREVTAEIINRIARRVAERASLDMLLTEVVQTINERYAFIYHSQVFLIEENIARLVASTGEIGKQLLARKHGLTVGSTSVIGQVTMQGKHIIARSGEQAQNTVHRRNELLSSTAVEAAFPLRLGNTVIGALDVQSQQPDAFDDPNFVNTLQALADSITLAIDNARQFENARERLTENERLVVQAREALQSVERLNERLTGRAWSEYLKETASEVQLEIDFDKDQKSTASTLTPTLQEAINNNYFVQNTDGTYQIVALPLRIRGQVIGAMEFELDKDHEFTPDDFDLMQEVSDRFGIAAENVRLVEQSQRNALREGLVNQINTHLQSSNNVEAMVSEAARSLHDVLKVNRVAIRLGTPPSMNGNGTGGTSNGH